MQFLGIFIFFVLALASLTQSAPEPRRGAYGAKGGFVKVQGPLGGSVSAGGFKAGGTRRG
jgi:hypothetical protein